MSFGEQHVSAHARVFVSGNDGNPHVARFASDVGVDLGCLIRIQRETTLLKQCEHWDHTASCREDPSHPVLPTLSIDTEGDFTGRNPLGAAIGTTLSLNTFHVHDPLQVDDHEAGVAVGGAPRTRGVDGRDVGARRMNVCHQQ